MKEEILKKYLMIIDKRQTYAFILGILAIGTVCLSIILEYTSLAIVSSIVSITSLAAVFISRKLPDISSF
jgi:uncharacterized membrane protein